MASCRARTPRTLARSARRRGHRFR